MLISDGKLEAERVDDQWHVHAWSVHERMGDRPPRRTLGALEASETPSELVADVTVTALTGLASPRTPLPAFLSARQEAPGKAARGLG
jgi:hypothetical protein